METIKYKDFIGSVEVSMEDDCIHGKIQFINDLITYESDTLKAIEPAFQEAVEDYINTCQTLGIEPMKSYSGSFNVRVGPELHQKLALKALQTDKNINSIVKQALEKHLSETDAFYGNKMP